MKKPDIAIRTLFSLSFIATVAARLLYLVIYGIERSYRFEVATITVNFLVMMVNGVLLSVYFYRKRKERV